MVNIFLTKPDGTVLGNMTGLQIDTCQISKKATDLWEISFNVAKYIIQNGKLAQSSFYDSITEMMYLMYKENDEIIYFMIDSEPSVNMDGENEYKTVTAHSIECELSYIYLKDIKINCGTSDSQEYLSIDENGQFNNIDDKGLPKEYISLVNYENTQLSLLHIILTNSNWTVAKDIPEKVCSIKKSIEFSNDSIYSALMKSISSTFKVIFLFDRYKRTVSAVLAEDYGEDSGCNIGIQNLLKTFDVETTLESGIVTKMIPNGADNLNVRYVNFGQEYIVDYSYFMNTINDYGDYKYVSKETHDNYNQWLDYCDKELIEYESNQYTRRELYKHLTKLYNQCLLDISNLKNQLPNDGCNIDYTTWKLDELKNVLKAYENAKVSIVTLYKNDYGVTDIGIAPEYTPTPSTAINIKDTIYWNDFCSYEETIIPKVLEAFKIYCKTDENGNLVVDKNTGEFIELPNGNPKYCKDTSIVKTIDSYLYEMSLYGLDELETKKKAWSEATALLYNECFEISDGVYVSETNGWNSLTLEQKAQFTSSTAFYKQLGQYLDYMSLNVRYNSLTQSDSIGVIRLCENAIEDRKNEINEIQILMDKYNSERNALSKSVDIFKWENSDGVQYFKENKNILQNLTRQTDYENSNYIITNLNDIVQMVDISEELYQDAIRELFEKSRPQYKFNTSISNLFNIEVFKGFKNYFCVGNFVRLYTGLTTQDNSYYKLRLMSISYNPLLNEDDLSVEFSTMLKSLNGISDLAFLLDEANSSSDGGSSNSSSGSSGNYGDNDANIQISNNIINALLKSETFGTQVRDVILDSIQANKGNFNVLFGHSGIFSSLESGLLKVNGDSIFSGILKSENYDGSHGSMLSLKDGTFSLGNGSLTYDKEKGFSIKGLSAEDLKLKSIVDIEKYYLAIDKESGVTKNTRGWTKEIQTMDVQKKFLWTYEVINYTDNTSSTTSAYIIGRYGTDGEDGKDATNVSSIETEYYVSTSSINCENGSWDKTYTWGKNKYLWTRNKIIWENNTVSYSKPQYSKYLTEYNMFQDAIVNGTTTINGGCIKTGILSSEDKRTWINLKDGQFSFGDGALTWDGNELIIGSINNKINTIETTLGGVSNTANSANNTANNASSKADTANNTANTAYNTANSASGKADNAYNIANEANNKADSAYNTANNASSGLSNLRTGLTNGTTTIHGGCIKTGNLISNNYNGNNSNVFGNTTGSIISLNDGKFNLGGGALKYDGSTLSVKGNIIANSLTANSSGTIAGWSFNSNAFYKNSETFGNSNGIYLGGNGFSYKDVFQISNNGFKCSSFNKNFRTYSCGFNFSKPIYNGNIYIDDVSYIIVWFNNVSNNESVDIRFQARRKGYKNGSYADENPTYSQWLPGANTSYSYDYYHGLRFNISDFEYYFDANNYMKCYNIINVWSPSGKQIKCIEYYNTSNAKIATIYNPNMTQVLNPMGNLSIDMEKGEIEGSSYTLSTKDFNAFINNYGDFSFNFYKIQGNNTTSENGIVVTDPDVKLDINTFKHIGVYNATSSSGINITIDSSGFFHRASSSSKRYKKDITQDIIDELNPHKLYDLNIYQFKYIDGYLSSTDQRYEKDIVNFLAEDLHEKYPIACDLNTEGLPENPNYNLLIAPMLKLIQEQHEQIQLLEKNIIEIKENMEILYDDGK